MSSDEVDGSIDSHVLRSSRVIGTCPCFRFMDGKSVCVNGDTIEDIDTLTVDPDIIGLSTGFVSQHGLDELPLCHKAIQVMESDQAVICVSRQMPIKVRDRQLSQKDLINALELFPKDMFSSEQDICTECLYKMISAITEAHLFRKTIPLRRLDSLNYTIS